MAPPGFSAHEYGWAFDLVVSPFDAIYDVGYTWEQWGGAWGGKKDVVHFELPGASDEAARLGKAALAEQGFSLADLLSIFYPLKAVDIVGTIGGTTHVRNLADEFLKSHGL